MSYSPGTTKAREKIYDLRVAVESLLKQAIRFRNFDIVISSVERVYLNDD